MLSYLIDTLSKLFLLLCIGKSPALVIRQNLNADAMQRILKWVSERLWL